MGKASPVPENLSYWLSPLFLPLPRLPPNDPSHIHRSEAACTQINWLLKFNDGASRQVISKNPGIFCVISTRSRRLDKSNTCHISSPSHDLPSRKICGFSRYDRKTVRIVYASKHNPSVLFESCLSLSIPPLIYNLGMLSFRNG